MDRVLIATIGGVLTIRNKPAALTAFHHIRQYVICVGNGIAVDHTVSVCLERMHQTACVKGLDCSLVSVHKGDHNVGKAGLLKRFQHDLSSVAEFSLGGS